MIYLVSNYHTPPPGIKSASGTEVVEWCKNKDVIGVDTETTGDFNFESDIFTLQLGDEENQFVIDTSYIPTTYFKNVLEDKSKLKLFQNASFDLKFFKRLGIETENVYDTFLAELVLNCGLQFSGFSLDILTEKYTQYQMSKDVREEIKIEGLTKRVIEYAAKDVQVLPAIKREQDKIAKQYSLGNVVKLENRAVLGFSDMEYNGILADVPYIKQIAKEDEQELQVKKNKLDRLVQEEPLLNKFCKKGLQTDLFEIPRKVSMNYNSPPQVLEAVNLLGVKTDSTGEQKLQKHKDKHEFIKQLIDYRKQQKLVSNYGKRFLDFVNPITGRVHTSFWQILNTGRVSSGKKPRHKSEVGAPNMQNIPSDNRYRNMFKASKGHKLVMSDYGSQELVLIADDSHDEVWVKMMRNGWDPHSVVAEMVFGDQWTEATEEGCAFKHNKEKCKCPEHKKMRTRIKTISYSLSYGAGAAKIAETLHIPVNEASSLIQMYFDTFPALRNYFDDIKAKGRQNLRIRTFPPFNRTRFFHNPSSYAELGAIERESTNTRIQGTGADIIKLAIVYIRDYIKENNYPAKLILQVHDELITEAKERHAEEWVQIKENLMRKASDTITSIPIEVESKISDKWEK